ncbi:uncharacterized protein LOC142644125 [Castanea sativa]|uniref:uncharacterized protein LOC142644125 n=1 Tax=Castanea sativa TaxID=21020 RepID=UPI003F64C97B
MVDGRMLDSNFLAQELHKYVLEDHTYKIKDLQNLMKERSINGDTPSTIIFKYVFWAFAPSIVGFAHCRLVISIDGTHLYGKYKGKLLIAMATDANNEIFLLAFMVVDDETGASWGCFLSCLRTAIQHVVLDSGICMISNRHKAIISSIEQWPHNYVSVYHRYCIRHVASNFNTQFKDPFLKSFALKVGYATQACKLDKRLDYLKEAELKFSKDPSTEKKKPYLYLMKEGLETWTLSHDRGRRYGVMTTNMLECFNGVLKDARELPISALVDYIWCKLVAYFYNRRTKILGDIAHGQLHPHPQGLS